MSAPDGIRERQKIAAPVRGDDEGRARGAIERKGGILAGVAGAGFASGVEVIAAVPGCLCRLFLQHRLCFRRRFLRSRAFKRVEFVRRDDVERKRPRVNRPARGARFYRDIVLKPCGESGKQRSARNQAFVGGEQLGGNAFFERSGEHRYFAAMSREVVAHQALATPRFGDDLAPVTAHDLNQFLARKIVHARRRAQVRQAYRRLVAWCSAMKEPKTMSWLAKLWTARLLCCVV